MPQLKRILEVLVEHEVDFIVVGGLAAVLQGTPLVTPDVDDLLEHVDWMEVSGHRIRVLSLRRLIRVKEQLTRPKDKLMLMLLQATLEEREKAKGD